MGTLPLEEVRIADKACIIFYADWHPPAVQMKDLLDVLPEDFPAVNFFGCDAEKDNGAVLKFKAMALPTSVLLRSGKEVGRLTGADPPALVDQLKLFTEGKLEEPSEGGVVLRPVPSSGDLSAELNAKLQRHVTAAPVVLFMKGTRDEPFCKFSKATLALFHEIGAQNYHVVNIFDDEEVRSGMKAISNWPTFPQLYVDNEFIGGLDVMVAMSKDGLLQTILKKAGAMIFSSP